MFDRLGTQILFFKILLQIFNMFGTEILRSYIA